MAWKYVEYQYASAQLIQKVLLWISNVDAHIYFGFRGDSSTWSYYAGDASHALATGKLLTYYATEAEAQTNYLSTLAYRETSGKVLAILPSVYSAKYAKLYVESGSSVSVYEWINSTYFTAHEIITGDLTITDQLASAPLIKVTASAVDRIKIGNFESTYYGIAGYNGSSQKIFELSDNSQNIAGWAFTTTTLASSDSKIVLDSSNKAISINDTTFGNAGIQLQYNSGNPQAYIGNGSTAYMKYTVAGGVEIAGSITATTGHIGGFEIGATTISAPDTTPTIKLDSANTMISLQTHTFGSAGVQLQYASSKGKFYAGDGSTNYFQWDGTNVAWKGVNTELTAAGAFTASSATITGIINATSGKIGTATNYWSIGSTGLTAVSASTDVIINYGKTDFGQDSTAGFILGYDYSATAPKFEIGSSASKILKYDGTDLTLIGGTITGGTIQTSATASTGIKLNTTALYGYNASNIQTVEIKTDGSGWFGLTGTKAISWTTAGAVSIGGWGVTASKLSAGTDADYIGLEPAVGIQLGDSTFADAPFSVTPAGVLKATSGTIGGNTLGTTYIQSNTYTAGIAGWKINSTGDAEFENVRIRGELASSVFKVSEVASAAGTFGLFYGSSTLYEDCTTDTSFTLKAKNSDTGVALFTTNSILRLKGYNGSTIADVWCTVSAVGTNSGTYTSYTCAKQSGTNATFKAGTAIVDYGVSGTGFLTMSADGTVGSSINLTMATHAGAPWTTTTTKLRLGNLNGSYGISNDYYGVGIGNYAGYYMRYDDNSGNLVVAGDIKTHPSVGAGTPGQKGVHLDVSNNELYFYGDPTGAGTSVEKLASIGIVSDGSDYMISKFGTENSERRAIYAYSKNLTGCQFVTVINDDSYYYSDSMSYVLFLSGYSDYTTHSHDGLTGLGIRARRSGGSDDTQAFTSIIGINIDYGHYSTYGDTTNAYGIAITPNHNHADSGVITTSIGLYLKNHLYVGTPTNYYGIYQEDTGASNFYAGYTLAKGGIRIGTTATDPGDNNLYVEGTSTFAGNITVADGITLGIGATSPASLVEIQGGLTTTGAVLTLGTKEPTVVANDILGRINFYAPLEADGSDAILVGASIVAIAEDTFSATVNKTALQFQTGTSEAATTKMTITNNGNVTINSSTHNARLGVWEGGLTLNYAAVAHGMTGYLPTNSYVSFSASSSTEGGLEVRAASDTGSTIPLTLRGLFGNDSGTNPAVMLYAAKKDGTGIQNLADTEIALAVNNGSVRLLTADGAGNIRIKTATTETGSTATLNIPNGTAPNAHVDNQIIIYSADSSDSTATLALYLEQAVEDIGTFTASHKIKVFINGTAYWLQLDAV